MKLLRQDLFTNQGNIARSLKGWKITGPINTLAGNDKVEGIAKDDIYGIRLVNGALDTASGNDIVSGRAGNNGIGIYTDEVSTGIIKTGTGADTVVGTAKRDGYGIFFWNNDSKIVTGPGDDKIVGKGGERSFGIVHYGTINTGNGSDLVKGTSGDDGQGLFIGDNSKSASLNTGSGNDRVIGRAGSASSGIIVSGGSRIRMGSGNDKMIAAAEFGISNSGTIEAGNGNDIVDALIGGFTGDGVTNLGLGNDKLIGFGTGFFDAGSEADLSRHSDLLLLPEGIYTILTIPDENGYFGLTKNGTEMMVKGFEFIGSASDPSSISEFILIPTPENSNSIIVDATGVQIIESAT